MSSTAIQWTEHVWNPTVGCSILSPGCTNCYAMNMAARIEAMNLEAEQRGKPIAAPQYDGTTKKVNGHAVWTGKLALSPERVLLQPLRRKKPTMYFVNSMSDLFHESVPDEWIDKVFAVMALCPQHTFQVLTKRAKRMREYFAPGRERLHTRWLFAARDALGDDAPGVINGEWPLPNVWLGVSTERQQEADDRIPDLLQTPAAVRFISAEPLLGPIDISDYLVETAGTNRDWYLDWVIAGGESGPDARPSHPAWLRSLRDQCELDSRARFFFKQWGSWKPLDQFESRMIKAAGKHAVVRDDGRFVIDTDIADPPRAVFTFNVGKKAAGRHLDGKLHDAMPQRADGKGR